MWLFFARIYADLPMCKESDYHFEYTECDVHGSRWRVAVPNKQDTCTGLPDPVKGTQCTFSCSDGEFLDMRSQECQKCIAGSYSLGTSVAFDEWESLPAGFVTLGTNMNGGDAHTNCSNSTWIPKDDYIASNLDECTSTLSYAVSLKKTGTLSFEYFYPDQRIFFEFFVQNDQSWEVAGEYIYTTPGDLDSNYMMLSLNVLGYRLPHSMAKDDEGWELARISFVFETKCTADCTLYLMAGFNERNNVVLEQWSGSSRKQSYSYAIRSNSTVSFTWAFQRTQEYTTEKRYSADYAKIYSVHITNVVGGVASQCRHCAVGAAGADSACVPCPPGHYMVNGTGLCRSCPANTIIRTEQPVGEEACIPCGPNTHSNKAQSACISECTLDQQLSGEELLHYDFRPLANITSFQSSPRFTSKGLRYFHHFSLSLCGKEGRELASCVDNVTESNKEVKSYVCQSTVVPSDLRGPNLVSSQPFTIGDTLVGITTETTLSQISSLEQSFPSGSSLPDVIFYYRSSETTQACQNGRSTTIKLRCDPRITATNQITLPRNCPEGTCDGCSFHFLWQTQHACPLCTESHFREIVSACIQGIQRTTYVWQQPLQCYGGVSLPRQKVSACVTLDFWLKFGVSTGTVAALLLIGISCYFWKKTRKLQYKYSKLMMTSGDKDCDLPAADSCAIMEGEDAEDDLIYLTKKSFFTKIKSFSRERSSDGFDSVPLKSSSGMEMEMT
ncbi:endosome/lysosome-associated apoptosis and autophagy regulator 1 [Aplochiton taeniatus]